MINDDAPLKPKVVPQEGKIIERKAWRKLTRALSKEKEWGPFLLKLYEFMHTPRYSVYTIKRSRAGIDELKLIKMSAPKRMVWSPHERRDRIVFEPEIEVKLARLYQADAHIVFNGPENKTILAEVEPVQADDGHGKFQKVLVMMPVIAKTFGPALKRKDNGSSTDPQ